MSLATRCTACGTVFRVVQDQLKVSEGWVRCGRCDQVFNAIEGLFDLERDAPPDWQPPPAPPQPPAASITARFQAPQSPPPEEEDVFHLSDDDRIHSRFFQPEQDDVAQTPAENVDARDRVEFEDAQFNVSMLAEEEAQHPSLERPPVDPPPAPAAAGRKRSGAASKAPPRFVREARAKARWRSPGVRAALSVAALGLAALLAAQVAVQFRDVVAQRWPGTRGALLAACRVAGCTIELPRRIDDLVVESSTLSPAAGSSGNYRLSVVLRNRGSLHLALPSVDLTLTDTDGQLVARRALSPDDFRSEAPQVSAGAETTMQLVLAATGARVSGYTVEIFYP